MEATPANGHRRRMRLMLKVAAVLLVYDAVLTLVRWLHSHGSLSDRQAILAMLAFTFGLLLLALFAAFRQR